MALERTAIIRTALQLLNETGLDGLTVRRLAERLGVQNPALYWHFKNKQALLNQMAAFMLADAFTGLALPTTSQAWESWLVAVVMRLRSALLRYRDGSRVVAGADLTNSELPAVQELVLRVLTDAGFDLQIALVSLITLFDYTIGAAFEEQSEPTNGASEDGQPVVGEEITTVTPMPLLTAAVHTLAAGDVGDRSAGFTAGVQLILAGMRAVKSGIGPGL